MKICISCNVENEESSFYKGHAKCKECYINKVKAYRKENVEKVAAYEKSRANLPHRIEARLKYSKTEAGIYSGNAAKVKWAEENVIKRGASHIVNKAIRDGKLFKPDNCEVCNIEHHRLHGHHEDYAYPMVVRWLCSKCHTLWHKDNGSGING